MKTFTLKERNAKTQKIKDVNGNIRARAREVVQHGVGNSV